MESSEPSMVGSFLSMDMLSAIAIMTQGFLLLMLLPHYDGPSAGSRFLYKLPLSPRLMTCRTVTDRYLGSVASQTYVAITSDIS